MIEYSREKIKKELNLKNAMEAPTVKKVVINAGIGNIRDSKEVLESFINDISMLAGQMPAPRKARLSEAGFKIKKGDVVGYMLTLRGKRMWAFLDKLINVALPRSRGFWGLSLKSFDGRGNYSIGIREHTVFPEVNPNTVKSIRPLQITIVTDANDDKKAYSLLKSLGFPFKEEDSNA